MNNRVGTQLNDVGIPRIHILMDDELLIFVHIHQLLGIVFQRNLTRLLTHIVEHVQLIILCELREVLDHIQDHHTILLVANRHGVLEGLQGLAEHERVTDIQEILTHLRAIGTGLQTAALATAEGEVEAIAEESVIGRCHTLIGMVEHSLARLLCKRIPVRAMIDYQRLTLLIHHLRCLPGVILPVAEPLLESLRLCLVDSLALTSQQDRIDTLQKVGKDLVCDLLLRLVMDMEEVGNGVPELLQSRLDHLQDGTRVGLSLREGHQLLMATTARELCQCLLGDSIIRAKARIILAHISPQLRRSLHHGYDVVPFLRVLLA